VKDCHDVCDIDLSEVDFFRFRYVLQVLLFNSYSTGASIIASFDHNVLTFYHYVYVAKPERKKALEQGCEDEDLNSDLNQAIGE